MDGFWSITVYNAKGFLDANELDAYAFNTVTAKRGDDGAVAIQFGGCDGKTPNCLPIMNGWNYTVRLYRPPAEILSGKWKFPQAVVKVHRQAQVGPRSNFAAQRVWRD